MTVEKRQHHSRGTTALSRNVSASAVEIARRKADAGIELSRDERHLLWQEYRRREREAAT